MKLGELPAIISILGGLAAVSAVIIVGSYIAQDNKEELARRQIYMDNTIAMDAAQSCNLKWVEKLLLHYECKPKGDTP